MRGLKKKITELAGVSIVDALYKFCIFHDLDMAISPSMILRRTKKARAYQAEAIERIQNKETVRVVLFLQTPSVWKYDTLYKLLEKSPFFEPYVVVSPYNVHLIYDKDECLKVMAQTEKYAQARGYRYISAYDKEHRTWLDIKKLLQPDIVFFSKPYKDTLPQYHIYNFKKALTLYVPYGINCMNLFRNNYGLPFHNLLWKLLVETSFQKQYATQYMLSKGENTEVVGALGVEQLLDPNYTPKDVWKPQPSPKKRIIWAPHHTVDYLFNFSNFLEYADEMLLLAEKYKDKIQIAFKPHPVLKFKLINIWGQERTDAYYQRWANMENGQLEEGDYMDLFRTSDAMIHDSGSFTVEYMYTRKPVLFQVKNEEVKKQWNSFGVECFSRHYHAYSIVDTERFIQDVVIDGKDPKQEERDYLYTTYLQSEDGKLPSEKIYELLLETLEKKEK